MQEKMSANRPYTLVNSECKPRAGQPHIQIIEEKRRYNGTHNCYAYKRINGDLRCFAAAP